MDVLIYAAATGKSLHSAASALESAPDDTALRDGLNAAFGPDKVLAAYTGEGDRRFRSMSIKESPSALETRG